MKQFPLKFNLIIQAIRDRITRFFKRGDPENKTSNLEKSVDTINQDDLDFIQDSKAALMTKSNPVAGFIVYTLAIMFLVLMVWAYFSPIDQITVGMAQVIPSSEVKVIQSLDGGIITEIHVNEGDFVKKGAQLVQFDDTRYKSDYQQALEKYYALYASITRLNAETQGMDSVTFSPELIKAHPDFIDNETKLFVAKKTALKQQVDILKKNYDLAQHELEIYKPLVDKGIVAKIDYYRSERNANEILHNIMDLQDKYRQDALTELNQRKSDFAVISEQLVSLKDKMQRTVLYSPVDGIIKDLNIHTIGAVVQPGQPILSIVPIEDSLVIQTKIKPADIAFIHIGQEATVKITAYDYTIYGDLKGKVEYISADTIAEQSNSAQQPNEKEEYYQVNIRTAKNYLGTANHKLPIIPGMKAMVYIKTGQNTVLKYILKPLIKAKEESLNER